MQLSGAVQAQGSRSTHAGCWQCSACCLQHSPGVWLGNDVPHPIADPFSLRVYSEVLMRVHCFFQKLSMRLCAFSAPSSWDGWAWPHWCGQGVYVGVGVAPPMFTFTVCCSSTAGMSRVSSTALPGWSLVPALRCWGRSSAMHRALCWLCWHAGGCCSLVAVLHSVLAMKHHITPMHAVHLS